jgi:iron complex outermembrane receptor protein
LLVRGSIGTGFKAPSVPQVSASIRPYGVTSESYTCTPELQAQATAQGAECQPGEAQYDQKAGGNKNLEPEKSVQGTLGIRFEPTPAMSFGADLWHVGIDNLIGQIPEGAAFGDPATYPNSWSSNKDVGTGTNYLAFLADNKNLGKYFATGIDFDVSGKAKTGVGDLSTQFIMTYFLREDQQVLKNGPYYSAIGINSPDLNVVTFKYQGRWATTLKTGAFVNTLAVNFKSGYTDQPQTVEVLDSTGAVTGTEDLTRHVKSYYSFDYNGSYDFNKTFGLSYGVLNLLDEDPPFSLVTVGANKGQQFGYDDRYYDPRGRTFFANLIFRF